MKTKGNPLAILQFIENLIKNEAFVEYDSKEFELKIKNHFMRCMLLDDLLTLDTPLCF